MSEGVSIFDMDSGVNFDEIEERRFSQVPAGIYRAVVTSIQDGKDQNSGKTRVAFKYTVTDADDERWIGKPVTERKYYKGLEDVEGLGYIKARFVDLGLPKNYRGPIDVESFLDTEVTLTLVQNGQYVNVSKVEVVEGTQEAGADGVTDNAADDLDDPFAS